MFFKKKIRPVVIGGYGISATMNSYSGTVGCLVTNGVNKFLLSSNHTIAYENKLPIGTPIVQPPYQYGGRAPKDTIGTLHRFVPLRFINGEQEPINLSDCAIALLSDKSILTPDIALIGRPTCVKSPILNDRVEKTGSTTELTKGVIQAVSGIARINFTTSGRRCLFKEIILTTQMGANGDSGAILVNNNKCAIGLLIANTSTNSCYGRLDIALDQLDVHLVT